MSENFPALTISQLTHAIKLNLETMFPNVITQGEISNLKVQSSGHIYFSLKDKDAQISAVMFKNATFGLSQKPKDGDHVQVKGDISVYAPRGSYQIVVREMALVGIGVLLQKLEELKIKLHHKGYFKQQLKKAIPKFPKKIGLITSPTGAVIRDIIHVMTRRANNFHLILNPVKVQGVGAAEEIAQAIKEFNRLKLVDVIIIARGGGSLEDLWAFNEEIVAKAIFDCDIPTICAVGHETDHSIADYVADVRAPTPSAAAEIITAESSMLLEKLSLFTKRANHYIRQLVSQKLQSLKKTQNSHYFRQPSRLLEPFLQKLDFTAKQLEMLSPFHKLADLKSAINKYHQALRQIFGQKLIIAKEKLKKLQKLLQLQLVNLNRLVLDKAKLAKIEKKLTDLLRLKFERMSDKLEQSKSLLKALDSQELLKKGYTILFTQNRKSVIKSVEDCNENDLAILKLFDGEISVTINKKLTYDR